MSAVNSDREDMFMVDDTSQNRGSESWQKAVSTIGDPTLWTASDRLGTRGMWEKSYSAIDTMFSIRLRCCPDG